MGDLLKIWKLSRSHKADSFEKTVEPHIQALYRLAWRWCANPEEAEDLLQETLCKLYPKREQLQNLDQLRPWLVRVMYHTFVDETRRRSLRPLALSALESPDDDGGEHHLEPQTEPHDEPESITEKSLTFERLHQVLQQLPEPQRALLILHDVEGYQLSELTVLLELPTGTLKARLHRGRERLRALLLDQMQPFDPSIRV
jgi:RNA polymerase sigma-70 factor (ECF subfamily)